MITTRTATVGMGIQIEESYTVDMSSQLLITN